MPHIYIFMYQVCILFYSTVLVIIELYLIYFVQYVDIFMILVVQAVLVISIENGR